MKLDHIGIAVRSLEVALKKYQGELGFSLKEIATIQDQKVRTAVLACGESFVELLEPIHLLSPIQKFLDQKGEGVHHLCFEVDDLEGKLRELTASSIQVIDMVPCRGLENRKIAFLHPKSTHGVLIELVEKKSR